MLNYENYRKATLQYEEVIRRKQTPELVMIFGSHAIAFYVLNNFFSYSVSEVTLQFDDFIVFKDIWSWGVTSSVDIIVAIQNQ